MTKEPRDRFATGMEFHRAVCSCLIDEAPTLAAQPAPAGGHTVSAEVTTEDGKTYVSGPYKLEFPSDRGVELKIGLKGDALTVKQKAG